MIGRMRKADAKNKRSRQSEGPCSVGRAPEVNNHYNFIIYVIYLNNIEAVTMKSSPCIYPRVGYRFQYVRVSPYVRRKRKSSELESTTKDADTVGTGREWYQGTKGDENFEIWVEEIV